MIQLCSVRAVLTVRLLLTVLIFRGRLAILKVHAKGKPIDSNVDMEVLARRTPGFTGADLANLVNEGPFLQPVITR